MIIWFVVDRLRLIASCLLALSLERSGCLPRCTPHPWPLICGMIEGQHFLVLLHSRRRELLEVIEPTLALGECARARQL